MNPAVLVYSRGAISPEDLISNILEANGIPKNEVKPNESENSIDVPTFSCNLKTKYYKNTLHLMPMEEKLHLIPANIRDSTEAIIIYFDANNKSLLTDLPDICQWLVDRNIELGILVTNKMEDNAKCGITRTELHKVCSESKFIFDVIDLAEANEDDDEDDESIRKHDYHEVLTALKNNIWSNVECKHPSASQTNDSQNLSEHDESMESQLEAFTNLMTNIQAFQRISGSLSRDQVLDQAEKLAELLCNTIMDGDDAYDDSDEDDTNEASAEQSAKSE